MDNRRTGRNRCDTCDCDLEFYFLKGGEEMKPRRYPYSGKRKKPIDQAIDFVIDQNAILQLVVQNSQLKHPESDLKIDKRMAF